MAGYVPRYSTQSWYLMPTQAAVANTMVQMRAQGAALDAAPILAFMQE